MGTKFLNGIWHVFLALVFSLFLIGIPSTHVSAGGALVVTSLNDGHDGNPRDGYCDTGTGSCILRAAIEEANAWLGADTFPGSTPEAAVPAFWVGGPLSLLLAAMLGVIAVRTRGRMRGLTAVLVVLILLRLFISFAFQDAFRAYAVEGPAMQTTAGLLRLFSSMDYLGVLLVIITAFLLPKKT